MNFIVHPRIPRWETSVIRRVGDILGNRELHEDHLMVMKDRFGYSNLDGPTLSHLILIDRGAVEVVPSYWFVTGYARWQKGKIILNANRLGGGFDADELCFLLGACVAGMVIDASPYWVHPKARANFTQWDKVSPLTMLGASVSEIFRTTTTARKPKGVYEYGTEIGTSEEGAHYTIN